MPVILRTFVPVIAASLLTGLANPALATTGKGCLRIAGVSPGDKLWLRVRPAASAPAIMGFTPEDATVIHLDQACTPLSLPWVSRWCPVSVFTGDGTFRGYFKARFLRDVECP